MGHFSEDLLDHSFAEEQTPTGELLLGSCLDCGLSAADAMLEVARDRDVLRRELNEANAKIASLTVVINELRELSTRGFRDGNQKN